MRRIYLALVAALALLAVAVPSATATPFATISATFSADSYSATINSTKGVSNYVVDLCDGTSTKYELSGDDNTVTAGPFDAQIVSLTVKAGRTVQTFYSGFTGTCEKKPPPDPKK